MSVPERSNDIGPENQTVVARDKEAALRKLVGTAILAPSGDNLQPWKFRLDPLAGRIGIILDETRDPSPMNAGQRMSRLAIGAAVENIFQAAKHWSWSVEPVDPEADECVAVRLTNCQNAPGELAPAIVARGTNRRPYDGRPLPAEMIEALRSAIPEQSGVRCHWITEPERMASLANLIGRSDALMLSEPSMRKAFLDNLRFDVPPNTVVEYGLSLGSLEVSGADRAALRMMTRMPDWLLRLFRAKRVFYANAFRLVNSASGLCVVTEPTGQSDTEILAGRLLQRAWLALTARGLSVQPMMSLAILESVLQRGSSALLVSLGRDDAAALVDSLRAHVPESSTANLAFIMRFGCASRPTVRTGRFSAEVSTERVPS